MQKLYETLDETLAELLKDPDFKAEWEKSDVAFDISMEIFGARVKRGWTQSKLAKKVGTHQSSIARIEDGKSLPSLRFLQKILDALEVKMIISFEDIVKTDSNPPKIAKKSIANNSLAKD